MPHNFNSLSEKNKNPVFLELVSDRMFRFSYASAVMARNLDPELIRQGEAYIRELAAKAQQTETEQTDSPEIKTAVDRTDAAFAGAAISAAVVENVPDIPDILTGDDSVTTGYIDRLADSEAAESNVIELPGRSDENEFAA